MRSHSTAIFTALALFVALGDARAENDAAASTRNGATDGAEVAELFPLTPPALLRGLLPPPRHVELPDGNAARPATKPLSLDLSLAVLRLAVHGDGTPGLSTFLGTSTAALGGFRLRF